MKKEEGLVFIKLFRKTGFELMIYQINAMAASWKHDVIFSMIFRH